MAGFWSGFAEGYQNERDRIEKRKLFQQEVLEKRRDALVPLVAKKQQQEAEVRKAQNEVIGFFKGRLPVSEDLSPEEQKAFLNLVAADPEVGLAIKKAVTSFDDEHDTRLEGRDLLRYTRVMEENKPPDMEMDEFVSIWAKASVTDKNGKFNAAATAERIQSAETTEELREIYGELSVSDGTPSVAFSGGDESMGAEYDSDRSGSNKPLTYRERKDAMEDYNKTVADKVAGRVKRRLIDAVRAEEEGTATEDQVALITDMGAVGQTVSDIEAGKFNTIDFATEEDWAFVHQTTAQEPHWNLVLTSPRYQIDEEIPNYAPLQQYGITQEFLQPPNLQVSGTPQVEVPEVEVEVPDLTYGDTPVYEPGREILEDDTPNDGYTNQFQDQFQ